MGRKRSRGRRKGQPGPDRLTVAEREAIAWCRGRGLYLLVHGSGRTREWVVYQRQDGAALGTYHPCTGRWFRDGRFGVLWEWREALDVITEDTK